MHLLPAFRAGLKEIGFVEGQNVAIEYRWAELQEDRLGEIAAELVRRQVAVIVTPGSTAAALAAKAETTTIPIVFSSGVDPVKAGLIASLNRPGGNATGIYQFSNDLIGKRLGILHEVVPAVATIALLVNPANTVVADSTTKEAQAAAHSLVIRDQTIRGLEQPRYRRGFHGDCAPANRRGPHHAESILYQPPCSTCDLGDPVCHSSNLFDTRVRGSWWAHVLRRKPCRSMAQIGVYVGRVLKGEKELPVEQSARFEFVINMQTARAFNLAIPSAYSH